MVQDDLFFFYKLGKEQKKRLFFLLHKHTIYRFFFKLARYMIQVKIVT
jgi:hypothetical protein